MTRKTIDLVSCNMYSVNCEPNDSVDIRCGGPPYLGYGFFVADDISQDEIISFIKQELKKNKQSFMSVSVSQKEVDEKVLWDKELISKCIKNGY